MSRKLVWKVVVLLTVIFGASVFAWYPMLADIAGISGPRFVMEKRLTLGLDLQGGVQFVLRVNTAEALQEDNRISHSEIVEQARQAVDRRINELGVVEPLILVQGDHRDEILVQLPGFTDVARARAVLGTTARLEWKLVEAGPESNRDRLLTNGTEPEGTEVLATSRVTDAVTGVGSYYLVRRAADVSGRDIRTAHVTTDDKGLPAVGFTLTPEGGRRFGELTAAHVGRQLAIVLDGRIQSAPVIEHPITNGAGSISGAFTPREAADLAIVLRSGALPVSLTYLGGQYVGPTLGQQSVKAGVGASLFGLALVGAFMLVYYNRAGVNAVLSVVTNLIVLLGAMAAVGAAMTLPGIAGLILTIGMGVDSNVLIFERIKEELKGGTPARSAVRTGFDRVFLTILDTHVASLIAAAFLFQFGSGPVRGFATTLTLGLLTNVFTAVVVSRTMFEVTLSMSFAPRLTFWTFARATRTKLFDFMAWRRLAFAVSAAVIIAGLAMLLSRGGLPLGLDFTGGTAVVAKFDSPVPEDSVRHAIPGDEAVQRYGPLEDHAVLIRVPQTPASSDDIESGANAIRAALVAGELPRFEITSIDTVSAALGAQFLRKGVLATTASLAGISAYIALRFRPGFAAGAIVATAHDLAVTVAMLGAFGFDLTLNTVAAILTIAGYSVNDTIVIFDRVRENLRTTGRMSIQDAVNLAVNQTLGRTVITAGTTFFAVLALFVFGGDVLHGFAFAMLVGIVTGTYSTIFVAAPIAALLARRRLRT